MRDVLVAVSIAVASAAAPDVSGDTRDVAREALAAHRAAIVTVRLTLKQRFIADGRERNTSESQIEIAGTLLTPEGLTVVSDVASNPAAMATSAPGSSTRLDSETGAVALVLPDGREVPARFVLRDSDLDLAFLVPREPVSALPRVELVEAPAPRPLDELIFLFPLSKSLNREIAVSIEEVRGVIEKPRTFVVADSFVGLQSLGCPAFDSEGRPIGLVVMRRSPIRARPTGGFRDMFEFLNPVVLTAVDVNGVALQALAHVRGEGR
jgi:hypothetical protein